MLKNLYTQFGKIAAKIENHPAHILHFLTLFFAILSLRLTLEFFSSNRLFVFEDVLHIGLWFVFIVLAFLVQLQFFSGESILKSAKLVITCFTIALSAPIIDLLINKGVPAKMNYLALNTWQEVIWSYCTVGGTSLLRGATLGIRIEIILLIIACFQYVRMKRSSVFWGIMAAISVYTVLFLSGAIPLILGGIVQVFHLQYTSDDQSTILLLLNLDLLLLFLLFYRHSPPFFIQFVRTIPYHHVGIACLLFVLGALKARNLYPDNWQLTPTSLFIFPLLVALGTAGVYYAMALKTQNPNEKRQFPTHSFIAIGMLIGGACISERTFFAVFLTWGLLFLYHSPVLHIQNFFLLRQLGKSLFFVAVLLMGFTAFGAPMVGFAKSFILVMSLYIASLSASMEIIVLRGENSIKRFFCIMILLITSLLIGYLWGLSSFALAAFVLLHLPLCTLFFLPSHYAHRLRILGLFPLLLLLFV